MNNTTKEINMRENMKEVATMTKLYTREPITNIKSMEVMTMNELEQKLWDLTVEYQKAKRIHEEYKESLKNGLTNGMTRYEASKAEVKLVKYADKMLHCEFDIQEITNRIEREYKEMKEKEINMNTKETNKEINKEVNIMFRKPVLVILEGGDKVGKSTLYQAFRRATKYGPLVIDRFIGSNLVYDKHYGRDYNEEEYLAWEKNAMEVFDIYLFLVTAKPEVQVARIMEGEVGKDLDIALENFKSVDALYRDYITKTSYKNVFIIDTTDKAPKESAQEMVQLIKEAGGRI